MESLLPIGTFIAGALLTLVLAQRNIEAQEMPFLVVGAQLDQYLISYLPEVAAGGKEVGKKALLVRVHNFGKGPALMGDVRLTVDGEDLLDSAGGQIPLVPGHPRDLPLQLDGAVPGETKRGRLRAYFVTTLGGHYMAVSDALVRPDTVLLTDFRRARSDKQNRPFQFQQPDATGD
jgi:hypothetical protein